MILLLVAVPFAAGIAVFLVRRKSFSRIMLVSAAVAHTVLFLFFCSYRANGTPLSKWFYLDDLGTLFLGSLSFLFLAAALYGVNYLRRESSVAAEKDRGDDIFANAPEALFVGCMLIFLSAMTLVMVSRHLGVIWIAIEATTLASAPLIYFHRYDRSLEATWKYLLICSVGIALALIGNLFLAIAGSGNVQGYAPLFLDNLIANASTLSAPCLKIAFIFILVGYGTKMGLAPMHTWLPDAHSEAPSVVSAVLSGALLNSAFLGILRVHEVCIASGLGAYSGDLILFFGAVSMAIAAVFILSQTDYKRMLAYSSIENMGFIALGTGLGGGAVFGSMLHLVNHSFAKAMMFLVAGNIVTVYRTRIVSRVKGALKILPISGILWVCGFLVISGMPPSGIFLSKFIVLRSALASGHPFIVVFSLAVVAVVFIGMSINIFKMAQSGTEEAITAGVEKGERTLAVLSPLLLLLAVVFLGLYVPPVLENLLEHAARAAGGS